MRLLCFDLATCSGHCYGDGSALPTVGHIKLPPPINGARGPMFSTFRAHVLDLIEIAQPDIIIGEAPILPKPFLKAGRIINPTNLATTSILQGLWAILEATAFDAGIRCGQIDIGSVKKELAGFGKAKKPDMVAAAEKVGLTIAVHDEADALAVWLCGVREFCPKEVAQAWDRLLWGSRGALL